VPPPKEELEEYIKPLCMLHSTTIMDAEIKRYIPNIDPVLSEYSVGYLNHASNTFTPDAESTGISPLVEAAASISALLVSASGDDSPENEKRIRLLVEKWVEKYSAANGTNGERRQVSSAARRLDQAIQVGAQRNMSSTLGVSTGGVDLESANVRKLESKVDRKKLEKAERKIAAKQNKKTFKAVEYEASRLLNQPDDAQTYEEFFMAVNPLQLGSNAQGQAKSKDIKIDGIDVSIGGLRILTDTSLTLAYGRRYGLVGQNGIGKSTLLRALARRELAIPVHISILHVEQEVSVLLHTWIIYGANKKIQITGDDTPALQAVLDADVWRKHLLSEQAVGPPVY
jgi:ATP-binding cassette, subfamily F, member 3